VKKEGDKFYTNTAMERRVPNPEFDNIFNCYRTDYVIGSGQAAVKAMTLSSDYKDFPAWMAAGGPGVANIRDFISETNYACSIDICTWFTHKANLDGWPWPKIDADRIAKVKTDEFRAGLKNNDTPMDGLKTVGSTMLHEVRL